MCDIKGGILQALVDLAAYASETSKALSRLQTCGDNPWLFIICFSGLWIIQVALFLLSLPTYHLIMEVFSSVQEAEDEGTKISWLVYWWGVKADIMTDNKSKDVRSWLLFSVTHNRQWPSIALVQSLVQVFGNNYQQADPGSGLMKWVVKGCYWMAGKTCQEAKSPSSPRQEHSQPT